MITIIDGAKGSGKTKKILDKANEVLAMVKGDVVFLAMTTRYRTEIKPQIKFIDAREESISNADVLAGFIKGLICGNYDIEYIFIDGILKMINQDLNSKEVEELFATLETISDRTNLVMTISCDRENLPSFISKLVK